MVVVAHGTGADTDQTCKLTDSHALSRNVAAATRSRTLPPGTGTGTGTGTGAGTGWPGQLLPTGSMVGTADEPAGRPRGDLTILPRNVRAPQGRVVGNAHPG
ncbi:hypothetical protein Sliba_55050 [Streptomyces nigrescens]|uniref:Uncharacterized protein n=1 Tax=Streptomyces nigrescens TaxID=1920 RepID=A0A640TQC2_STRNI|nr:hypothetical protein Sliba_55050 [Streptomyces libani subsp. libani]GGW04882.1 hypothetical protein GCM10010500_67770 [Streptomyces libani subsp. libani]